MNSAELTELSDLYCFWCGTERDMHHTQLIIILGFVYIYASRRLSSYVFTVFTFLGCQFLFWLTLSTHNLSTLYSLNSYCHFHLLPCVLYSSINNNNNNNIISIGVCVCVCVCACVRACVTEGPLAKHSLLISLGDGDCWPQKECPVRWHP